MKKLKNLTIASTLCVSACITAPTLTNAVIKSGQPVKPHSNFKTKTAYITFTGNGKKTAGPLVQSRLIMLGDGCTSTSTPSRQPLPSNSSKKQVHFWDSPNSKPSTISNKSASTQTSSPKVNNMVKERVKYFESLIEKNSNSSTKKSISTQTQSASNISMQTLPDVKLQEPKTSLSKRTISTQTKNTSDASTQTTTSLNKSTQTITEKSNKSTQTEPQTSKSKLNKLRKFFGN